MTADTMDEAEGGEAEGQEQPPRKIGGKKLILFAALGALVLGGIAAGLFFSGILGGDKAANGEEQAAGGAPAASGPALFYDLPDLLVNLNTGGKRQNFLKISISLELDRKEDEGVLKQVLPRIVDNFQVYLRELRLEDLRGSAGMYRLREELLMRVNTAAHPVKIKDVLFREMLVQ